MSYARYSLSINGSVDNDFKSFSKTPTAVYMDVVRYLLNDELSDAPNDIATVPETLFFDRCSDVLCTALIGVSFEILEVIDQPTQEGIDKMFAFLAADDTTAQGTQLYIWRNRLVFDVKRLLDRRFSVHWDDVMDGDELFKRTLMEVEGFNTPIN